jgi:hypothetical protein
MNGKLIPWLITKNLRVAEDGVADAESDLSREC